MDDKSDRKDAPKSGMTHAVKGGLGRAPASAPRVQVVPRQTNESDGDLAAEHHAGPHSLPQAHVDFAPAKAVIVDIEPAEMEEAPRKKRAIATQIIPRDAIAAATKRAAPARWPYVVGIVAVLAAMGWFVTRRPLDESAHDARNQNENSLKIPASMHANPAVTKMTAPPAPAQAMASAGASGAVIEPSKSAATSIASPSAAASIGSLPIQCASKDLKFLEPKK